MIRVLLVLSLACLASADLAPLYEHATDGISGQFIVALKETAISTNTFLSTIVEDLNIKPMKVYRNGAFKGFTARLILEQMNGLRSRDEVAYVEEDSVMRSQWTASWGLDRVDQRTLPLDGKANFQGTGSGVNAYIIDTGIYPKNLYFSDRAFIAYDAVGDQFGGEDCNGHGTHCSGTIGGEVFGIAREANLFGVKTLGCSGSGTTSGVIDGMDFVATDGMRPAVASMSLGGGKSTAMNEAVARLVAADVTVSVAAGNDYGNACNVSPGSAEEAITVGATDIEDKRAAFSNSGTCVDIFAPGVDISSLWMGGNFATNTISGTSMACPHVSGAAVLAAGNNPLSAAQVKAQILSDGTKDVVQDAGPGSPNLFLYIP